MWHPSDKRGRRSTRLPSYDYAQTGAYFLTICARGRRCLFGQMAAEAMRLNWLGDIVRDEWVRAAEMREEIHLDAFVIMPNHLHGIVMIEQEPASCQSPPHAPGERLRGVPRRSLGSFVIGFKSAVTRRVRKKDRGNASLWQRNYYEHVVRSEEELNKVREYILCNPARWAWDSENPLARRRTEPDRPWE